MRSGVLALVALGATSLFACSSTSGSSGPWDCHGEVDINQQVTTRGSPCTLTIASARASITFTCSGGCTQTDDSQLPNGVCYDTAQGIGCTFDDGSRREMIDFLGLQDLDEQDRYNAQATLQCDGVKSSWSPSFCGIDNRAL